MVACHKQGEKPGIHKGDLKEPGDHKGALQKPEGQIKSLEQEQEGHAIHS